MCDLSLIDWFIDIRQYMSLPCINEVSRNECPSYTIIIALRRSGNAHGVLLYLFCFRKCKNNFKKLYIPYSVYWLDWAVPLPLRALIPLLLFLSLSLLYVLYSTHTSNWPKFYQWWQIAHFGISKEGVNLGPKEGGRNMGSIAYCSYNMGISDGEFYSGLGGGKGCFQCS